MDKPTLPFPVRPSPPEAKAQANAGVAACWHPRKNTHGLHLVKGSAGPEVRNDRSRTALAGASQARAIVLQVEREVAAAAARRATNSVRATPLLESPEARDTPWQVLTRVLHGIPRWLMATRSGEARPVGMPRSGDLPARERERSAVRVSWPFAAGSGDALAQAADGTSSAAEPAHV